MMTRLRTCAWLCRHGWHNWGEWTEPIHVRWCRRCEVKDDSRRNVAAVLLLDDPASTKDLAAEASTAPSLGHPEVSSTAETSDVASPSALRPPVDEPGWEVTAETQFAIRFGNGALMAKSSPEIAASTIRQMRAWAAETGRDIWDQEPMTVVQREVGKAIRATEWREVTA